MKFTSRHSWSGSVKEIMEDGVVTYLLIPIPMMRNKFSLVWATARISSSTKVVYSGSIKAVWILLVCRLRNNSFASLCLAGITS